MTNSRNRKTRDRSRRAVEARTPMPTGAEGMVERSFQDRTLEELQADAERDIYVETARLHGTDPLGMLPQEPKGRHAR